MQVRRTLEFTKWSKNLRDRRAKAKILARIDRLEDGNAGDPAASEAASSS
jgi:putative addiction module killer protein